MAGGRRPAPRRRHPLERPGREGHGDDAHRRVHRAGRGRQPRRGRAGPPGPALPHGLRLRAPRHRPGTRPRGGHLGRRHLRRALLAAPPGRGRALRPPLGRRPRARAGRHPARPPVEPPLRGPGHGPPGRGGALAPAARPPQPGRGHARPAHRRERRSCCSRSWPGPSSAPSSRKALLARSGGNPFFLEELVTLLADAGMVGADGPPAACRRRPRRAARHAARAWWRPASTASPPTSAGCSTTAPCSAAADR